MVYYADFHIHSRFARATSRSLTLPVLDEYARKKGIKVLGTGDFTHPQWFSEIKSLLTPAKESGLFILKDAKESNATRFILSVEISSIYQQGGRGRRVHTLVMLPSIEAAEEFNRRLEAKGAKLASDGRPIVGLSAKQIAQIAITAHPQALIIPAHAWTPWFSIFGSMSGFDSLEECFEELTPRILAIETGLSCYDDKTEVLTENGWKRSSQVTRNDKMCTLNLESEEIEYQRPQKIYKSKYKGKMYRLKTKRADLLVTPNHNMLYAPADFRKQRPYRLKEARELFRKSKILRKDGNWKGQTPRYFVLPEVKIRHGSRFYSGFRTKGMRKFPIRPWLKFFGFWIAEGWTTAGKNGHYAVCIANRDHKLMSEMRHILKSFGYTVFWDRKTTNTIRVRDNQLFHYLQQFGKAADKYVPLEVKKLSKELLELFLEYYVKGDGHIYGRSGKGLSATTISRRLCDDLQEVALKMGISAYYKLHNKKGVPFASPSQKKMYKQNADSWNIYFIRKNRHAIIPSEMKKYGHEEQWVNYDGMVYCVSVPNRTVYTRRGGIPLWCGNSDPPMNWRLSALDNLALISSSDAHSASKIAREATKFEGELSYVGMGKALRRGSPARAGDRAEAPTRLLGTIEFFPQEGKYHFDGHSAHKVRWSPQETRANQGICPVCGRRVTVGVLSRVEKLADRPIDFRPKGAPDYWPLVPLEEIIAEACGAGVGTKKVADYYKVLLQAFDNELAILLDEPIESIEATSSPIIAEGVKRVRAGKLNIEPGYDGEYGTVHVFTDADRQAFRSDHQTTLL